MDFSYKPLDPMSMGELAFFRKQSINSNPFDEEQEPMHHQSWVSGWKQASDFTVNVLGHHRVKIVK